VDQDKKRVGQLAATNPFPKVGHMNEVLRLLRVFHDMKGYELAEQLNVSKSYLSEIENGKKEPSIALIKQYAKVFNTTPSAIMFLAENLGADKENNIEKKLSGKMLGLLKELANENAENLFD